MPLSGQKLTSGENALEEIAPGFQGLGPALLTIDDGSGQTDPEALGFHPVDDFEERAAGCHTLSE